MAGRDRSLRQEWDRWTALWGIASEVVLFPNPMRGGHAHEFHGV
jgi:hypothetical protein